jgi:Spy/CpxP family protein refolding chaperone
MLKRILSIIAASVMIAAVSVAYQQKSGQKPDDQKKPPIGQFKGGQDRMAHLQKELNLTPDQVKKVKSIMEAQSKKMAELRKNGQNAKNHTQNRAKFDALRKDTEKQIRNVLTAAQKTKYDAMVKKMEEQRKKFREGRNQQKGPKPTRA